MEVNKNHNVSGEAEGKHVNLDIGLPLFVGGLPNFNVVKNNTGYTSGFKGNISKF